MADEFVSIDIADAEEGVEEVTDADPETSVEGVTDDGEPIESIRDATGDRSGVRSEADGGIVAQLRLDHPKLFLRPTIRHASDVTVEPDYWTTVEPGRTLVFVTVYGTAFDAFETALETDPTVTDPVLVDRYPDRRIYRVTRTDRARDDVHRRDRRRRRPPARPLERSRRLAGAASVRRPGSTRRVQ